MNENLKTLNQDFYTQFCQILRHAGITMNSADYEKLRLSCSKWFSTIEQLVDEKSTEKMNKLQDAVIEGFENTEHKLASINRDKVSNADFIKFTELYTNEFKEIATELIKLKKSIIKLDLNIEPQSKLDAFEDAIPGEKSLTVSKGE